MLEWIDFNGYTNLQLVDDPDEIELLNLDRRTLPPGDYQESGFKVRQLFDIQISRHVTNTVSSIAITNTYTIGLRNSTKVTGSSQLITALEL